MNKIKLKEILRLHQIWLNGGKNGECADLSSADLCYADLSYVNLSGADLSYSNLSYSNLRGANLCKTNLNETNLRGANLCKTNLNETNLSYSNLRGANLCYADLNNPNSSNTDLKGTNLNNAKYNASTSFLALQCPEEGSFIGYKTAKDYLVKLLITEDALRSSATSRKCRCSKAKVLKITNIDTGSEILEVASDYDSDFVYKKGEISKVDNFDINRWDECAPGIHFFITKEEALIY